MVGCQNLYRSVLYRGNRLSQHISELCCVSAGENGVVWHLVNMIDIRQAPVHGCKTYDRIEILKFCLIFGPPVQEFDRGLVHILPDPERSTICIACWHGVCHVV